MRTTITHPSRRAEAAGGFTLTELLVVVAIIGILASLTYAALDSAIERAKMGSTRTLVGSISTGMQMFKSDFGHLPTNDDDGTGEITNDPEYIRLWLLGIDDDGDPDGTHANKSSRKVRGHANWNGPYLEYSTEKHLVADYDFKDENNGWTESNLKYVLVDAWDQRIYFETYDSSKPKYQHRPIHNMDKWDVWSRGQDGNGTVDDEASITYSMRRFTGDYTPRLEDYNSYTEKGIRVNRDNIGNW